MLLNHPMTNEDIVFQIKLLMFFVIYYLNSAGLCKVLLGCFCHSITLNNGDKNSFCNYTICWFMYTAYGICVSAVCFYSCRKLVESLYSSFHIKLCAFLAFEVVVLVSFRKNGDGAGITVEENSIVFSLILMHYFSCYQQGHAGSKTSLQQNPLVHNWDC